MKFCQKHWDALRLAITSRGLGDLIATSGEEIAKHMTADLNGANPTQKNFEPLMAAHNKILENALDGVQQFGADPMLILAGHPEHPECECPICCLNFLSDEHDRTCTNPECKKPKGLTFDDWIDKAADGVAAFARSLPPE